MAREPVDLEDLLVRAAAARDRSAGEQAHALYTHAADLAEREHDLPAQVVAVLGLARCQEFNLAPGDLPVRLHAVYEGPLDTRDRVRVGTALARCWAYAGEPRRAVPFADEALALAETVAATQPATQDGQAVLCDALDAALATYWGPDDLDRRRGWAVRLGDAAAHLPDRDARLQAHLWDLVVAWEVLDLPRMQRQVRALERLGDDSPRARFFAASRRLALDLMRGRTDTSAELCRQAEKARRAVHVPDGEVVLHAMTSYTALVAGDTDGCAAEAAAYEDYALREGVAVVLAEAAMIWTGAGRPDRVAGAIAPFTREALADLPRDCDWLLSLQCVLEAALAVGDGRVVGDVLELLAPYEGRAVVNAGAVMFHGVTDDPLSRAHSLLGDHDAAARLRASALDVYQHIGATWWRERLLATGETRTAAADVPEGPGRSARLQHLPDGTWSVGSGHVEARLPDLRGLGYLHALVRRPGIPVAATELVGARGGTVVQGDLGEVLDEPARAAYRRRIAELDAELTEAEEWADEGRRQRAVDEREAVLAELAAATGLGGRHRTTGSTHERARVAVRKALVGAIARVAEVDPWLGRHLRDRVRTGTECVYDPDPDRPLHWETG